MGDMGTMGLHLWCGPDGGLSFHGRRLRRSQALARLTVQKAGILYVRPCSRTLFPEGLPMPDTARGLPDGAQAFEELGNGAQDYGRYGFVRLYVLQRAYPSDLRLLPGMFHGFRLRGEPERQAIGPDGDEVLVYDLIRKDDAT